MISIRDARKAARTGRPVVMWDDPTDTAKVVKVATSRNGFARIQVERSTDAGRDRTWVDAGAISGIAATVTA